MSKESQEQLNTSLTTLTIKDEPSSSSSSVPSQEPTTSNTSSSVTIKTEVIEKEIEQKEIESKDNNKKKIFRDLPVLNVPEKIIICLDTCADPEYTAFKTGDDTSSYPPMAFFKRVVEIFVHHKHVMDPRHEFALLALEDRTVKRLQEFTTFPREIVKAMNEINKSCDQEEEYDLSVLLDEVWQMVSVPKKAKDLSEPPPYVVRLILLYSRSYATPVLKKSFNELLENPYFIIDVISSYEEVIDKTLLNQILNNLQIDEKGYSYNFGVGRSVKMLHEAMAKLLAHPLQRPFQSEIMTYASPVFEKEE